MMQSHRFMMILTFFLLIYDLCELNRLLESCGLAPLIEDYE